MVKLSNRPFVYQKHSYYGEKKEKLQQGKNFLPLHF